MIGKGRWRGSALLALMVSTLLVGCRGDEILVPNSDEPFLYLVLNERMPNERVGHAGQFGFLLTSGSPAEPARLRCAESFAMRGAGEVARFRWRSLACSGEVGGYPGVSFNDANYYLPDSSTAEGRGAEAIQPDHTYEILIETAGRTIQGSVRVPASFTASVVVRDGQRTAVWPQVAGAAGYQIRLPDDRLILQRDTSYVLPEEAFGGGDAEIRALDPNLWRYVTEDRIARSGIEGGLGVFGAITRARLTF